MRKAQPQFAAVAAAVAGLVALGGAAYARWAAAPPAAGRPASATALIAARAEPASVAAAPPSASLDARASTPSAIAITEPVSPALRATADRSLPQQDRLRPLVNGALTSVSSAADIALLRNVLRDPGDDDTIRNEAANLLRASGVAELAGDLRAVLAEPREQARFRSFAAQHLGVLLVDARRGGLAQADDLRRELAALLRDRHVEVVREALLALSRAGASDALAEVERLLVDERRGDLHDLCIRIVAEKGWREQLPRIRALAGNGDPVVRVAAIVALGDLRDDAARSLLEAAAAGGEAQLAAAARAALAKLDRPAAKERP